MARNPNYQITFSTIDQSGEMGTFSLNVADLLAVNPVPAAVTAFIEALGSIQDGTMQKWNSVGTKKMHNDGYAPDGNREDKVMLTYEDSVTLAIYQTDIPCRNNDLATIPGQDEYDLTAAPWDAFVTAFEALAKSPDGNAVNLISARLVGRNV